jgi:protein phosphatase
MAEATRGFTDSVLSFGQKHFLRHVPLYAETRRENTRFYLCHAIPSDPLFGYCEAESSQWLTEVENVDADVILVGHTHVPAMRSIGSRVVVNPGSLGQPKTGSPEARYAVWEDGRIELKSYTYPFEATVAKLQNLPIEASLRNELSTILRTGVIPDS